MFRIRTCLVYFNNNLRKIEGARERDRKSITGQKKSTERKKGRGEREKRY